MTRFESLKYAPAETRRILRERFARKLHVIRQPRHLDPYLAVTPDLLALSLLAGTAVSHTADWAEAGLLHGSVVASPTEPADLAALEAAGWIRRIWGRVEIPMDLRVRGLRAAPGAMDAFKALVQGVHAQAFDFAAVSGTNEALGALLRRVAADPGELERMVVQTPAWVAARLWEVVIAEPASRGAALRRWVDLWGLLKHPEFVPAKSWTSADAETFREAVLAKVESEPGLGDWTQTRALYARQLALEHDVPLETAQAQVPVEGRSLVDRALWIEKPMVEGLAYGSLEATADVTGLIRLLLADVEAQDTGPAPNPVTERVIGLALDRPEVFVALLFQMRARPALLADLVLDPRTTALACLLIARWAINGGACDRPLIERDQQANRAEAFTDAVALLGHHLRQARTEPREATAFYVWADQQSGNGYVDDVASSAALLSILRRELGDCPSAVLLAMMQALDQQEVDRGLGGRQFACMLDLAELGDLAGDLDAEAILAAYAGSLVATDHRLPAAHRVGAASAALLSQVSQTSDVLRQRFLFPIDVRATLAGGILDHGPDDPRLALARGLRAHIRILCRAILGGPSEVPADIVDALAQAIRSAALDHPQKGRVAGFAPHHETNIGGWVWDRPLSDDLAAALARLGGEAQSQVLDALLQTDEPLLLAQLLSRVGPKFQTAIRQRLTALAPMDAGAIHSLPEMQVRIDELLKAGAADAAAAYMAAEEQLQTLGRSPGRERVRFQNQLRLAFLKQDWAAITGAPEPTFVSPQDNDAAKETLLEFRGLVALKGPNPDPTVAKAIFADLYAKRPSLGFATNWLAAAVTEVLADDGFALLDGPRLRTGQAVAAEADRMLVALPGEPQGDVFNSNLAILLLALGQPDRAMAVVSGISNPHQRDHVAALRAVALARQGRVAEATATLDEAERTLGTVDILVAARKHIAGGAGFLVAPDVSVFDDLRDNLAAAIARFRLLNPSDQAGVLRGEADPLAALLIDHVRAAADAVTQLVPMMKEVVLDETEDDLNAVVQRLLGARVDFMGWSAHDQSKGGFSEAGNPGERDILVSWKGSLLAVIEALVCKRPLTQDVMRANLESHFQKLLGYGLTRLFFHLTYAYDADISALIGFLEQMAETTSPPGFTFQGRDAIEHQDSRPTGFVARYQGDVGEVKVVFLVMNMGQDRQRAAGKIAGVTKARKAPRKPKSTKV